MSKDAGGASLGGRLRDFITQRRERRVVTVLRWFRSKLTKSRDLPRPTFEPLSPVDVADDKMMVYESELLNALRIPEVRNIAITGGYGAGKSSLIKSFVRRHPEYKFAFISLAAFEGEELADKSNADGSRKAAEEAIESTIVQQLLYSVQARNVPGTRLRRITYAAKSKVGLAALCVSATALAYLRLMPTWPQYLPNLAGAIAWIPEAMAQIAFVVGVTVGIYWLIRTLSNLRLQEFSFKGVKWDGSAAASVLHKHVDELIHLFEMVPTDIVFVEDLDRFRDRLPFVRLREINFIVNSSVGIRHPIRFVYALNDELFGRDDKAKFFDIAIPVVPVINAENTRDMFMTLLEKKVSEISDNERVAQLVETIAYHVGDLRQIKQMVNEFQLYRAVLKGGHTGDVAKELAMVAIRCIYPQEYAALLKGDGDIRLALSMFPAWQRAELKSCDEERQKLLEMEAQRRRESLSDVADLMALVWSKIEDSSAGDYITSIEIDGVGRFTKQEFIGAHERIEELAATKRMVAYRGGNYSGQSTLNEVLSSGNPSLRERIAMKARPVGPDVKALEELTIRLERLRSMSLHDALHDASFMGRVSEHCDMSGIHLIPYLMRSGFLGLDYADYIGYFYPGAISQQDKIALLDLRTGKLLDTDHQFTSPALVLNKLSVDELGAGVGMVSSLVCAVLDDRLCDPSLRLRRFGAIFFPADTQLDRMAELLGALHQGGRLGDVISEMKRSEIDCVLNLAESGKLSSRPDVVFAVAVAVAGSLAPSLAGESRVRVANLLSGLTDLHGVLSAHEAGLLGDWYLVPGARMARVRDDVDSEVLKRSMRSRVLQVNPHNVMLAAKLLTGVDIPSAKYSELLSLGSEDVIEFAHSNWYGYVESTYAHGSAAGADEPEHVLLAMLQESGGDPLRELVLRCVRSTVTELDSIPTTLWPVAFDYGHVASSMDNLVRLAMLDASDDSEKLRLAGMVLEDINVLEAISSPLATEENIEALCRMLAKAEDRHTMTVAQIIVNLRIFDMLFQVEDDNEELLAALVRAGLPLTKETFDAIVITSDSVAISIAIGQFDKFLKYMADSNPGTYIIEGVMGSSLISVAERRELYALLDAPTIAASRVLATLCKDLFVAARTEPEVQALYDQRRVDAVFHQLEDEDEVMELLSSVLLVAPWRDLEPQFHKLKESGFSPLAGHPYRIEVRNNKRNVRLLEALRKRGIVGSPNRKEDKIWSRVRTSKLK